MATKLISVDFDIDRVRRELHKFTRRQVPFATARSLNGVVIEAQSQLRKGLAEYFTVRSTWVARGIITNRATKANLVAAIGSRDDFMQKQAEGGEKNRGHQIGVPVKARRTKRTKITRGKFPRALLDKGAFVKKTKGGTDAVFMPVTPRKRRAVKVRRRKRRTKRRLKLMYYLVDSVTIPKRWPFLKEVATIVDHEWPVIMRREWRHALRTMRRT